tara:strand:- start:41631 stop:42887 length:1257 start_codon:yes stop_codon:yes gene_type:complete
MHSNKVFLIKTMVILLSRLAFALILTACGNSEDAQKLKDALDVNQLNITSLQVSSDKSIIEALETLPMKAEAFIANESTPSIDVSNKVKWSSSNNNIASINSEGLLTGKAVGLVTITATLADLFASTDIQLSDALLETIDIINNNPSSVSVCRSGYELIANGNYDDATVRNITTSVTWTPDDPTRLSIDASGVFSTHKDGTSTVTATKNSITDSTDITINDDIDSVQINASDNSIYTGNTLAFTATGTYDDTSTADITNNVTWASDDEEIVSISNETNTKGLATGISEGSANISARCLTTVAEESNSLSITVAEEPVINNIAIEEDKSILEFKLVDSPEQLTANLKRSDNSYSTNVSDDEYTTWSVNDTISGTALSIDNTGEITFTEVGITEIEVRYYDNNNGIGPFTDTIEVQIVTN